MSNRAGSAAYTKKNTELENTKNRRVDQAAWTVVV